MQHKGSSWSWQLLPLVCMFLSHIFLLLLLLSAQAGPSCIFTVFSFQPLSVAFSASPHPLFYLSGLMPTSCSYIFQLRGNPLPRVLLPERNEQGLCLYQGGWTEEEEPCEPVGGERAGRGEQCCRNRLGCQ